jgi:hypothetical protein
MIGKSKEPWSAGPPGCHAAFERQNVTANGQRRLVAVNYAANQGQCYVRLALPDLTGRAVRLKDLMSFASYDRDGNDLASRGLYLDVPAWSHHAFEMTTP